MENNETDFYAYGYRKGLEDESIKNLERSITVKYGEEASLQFLAGFIAAQEDQYIKGKSDDFSVKSGGPLSDGEYVDAEMIDGSSGLDYNPYIRNNSFYGGTGISHVYNQDGTFNEPPVDENEKAR